MTYFLFLQFATSVKSNRERVEEFMNAYGLDVRSLHFDR